MKQIKLKLTSDSGKKYEVDVGQSYTIEQVKKKIEDQIGISASQINLVLNNRLLDDSIVLLQLDEDENDQIVFSIDIQKVNQKPDLIELNNIQQPLLQPTLPGSIYSINDSGEDNSTQSIKDSGNNTNENVTILVAVGQNENQTKQQLQIQPQQQSHSNSPQPQQIQQINRVPQQIKEKEKYSKEKFIDNKKQNQNEQIKEKLKYKEKEKIKRKETDEDDQNVDLPCEFCNELIPQIQYDQHVRKCEHEKRKGNSQIKDQQQINNYNISPSIQSGNISNSSSQFESQLNNLQLPQQKPINKAQYLLSTIEEVNEQEESDEQTLEEIQKMMKDEYIIFNISNPDEEGTSHCQINISDLDRQKKILLNNSMKDIQTGFGITIEANPLLQQNEAKCILIEIENDQDQQLWKGIGLVGGNVDVTIINRSGIILDNFQSEGISQLNFIVGARIDNNSFEISVGGKLEINNNVNFGLANNVNLIGNNISFGGCLTAAESILNVITGDNKVIRAENGELIVQQQEQMLKLEEDQDRITLEHQDQNGYQMIMYNNNIVKTIQISSSNFHFSQKEFTIVSNSILDKSGMNTIIQKVKIGNDENLTQEKNSIRSQQNRLLTEEQKRKDEEEQQRKDEEEEQKRKALEEKQKRKQFEDEQKRQGQEEQQRINSQKEEQKRKALEEEEKRRIFQSPPPIKIHQTQQTHPQSLSSTLTDVDFRINIQNDEMSEQLEQQQQQIKFENQNNSDNEHLIEKTDWDLVECDICKKMIRFIEYKEHLNQHINQKQNNKYEQRLQNSVNEEEQRRKNEELSHRIEIKKQGTLFAKKIYLKTSEIKSSILINGNIVSYYDDIILNSENDIKIGNEACLSSQNQDIKINIKRNIYILNKSTIEAKKNININNKGDFKLIGGSTIQSGGNIDINSNHLEVSSMQRLSNEEQQQIHNIKLKDDHIYQSTNEAMSSTILAGGNISIRTPRNKKELIGIFELYNHQIVAQGNLIIIGRQLHNFSHNERQIDGLIEKFPGTSIIKGNNIQINMKEEIINAGQDATIQSKNNLTLLSDEIKIENHAKLSSYKDILIQSIGSIYMINQSELVANTNIEIMCINNFRVLSGSQLISKQDIIINSNHLSVSSMKRLTTEEQEKIQNIKLKEDHIYQSTNEAMSSTILAGGNISITTPRNGKELIGIFELYNHQIVAQGNLIIIGRQLHNFSHNERKIDGLIEKFPGTSIIKGNNIQINIKEEIINAGQDATIQSKNNFTLLSDEIKIENHAKLSSYKDILIQSIGSIYMINQSELVANTNIEIMCINNFRVLSGSQLISKQDIIINSNHLSVSSMKRMNDEELQKIQNNKTKNNHIYCSSIEAISSKLIAGGNITITTPQTGTKLAGILNLYNHKIIALGNIKITGQQFHNISNFERPLSGLFERFPGASIIEGNDIQINTTEYIKNIGQDAIIYSKGGLSLESNNDIIFDKKSKLQSDKDINIKSKVKVSLIDQAVIIASYDIQIKDSNILKILGGSSIDSKSRIIINAKNISVSSLKRMNNEELEKIMDIKLRNEHIRQSTPEAKNSSLIAGEDIFITLPENGTDSDGIIDLCNHQIISKHDITIIGRQLHNISNHERQIDGQIEKFSGSSVIQGGHVYIKMREEIRNVGSDALIEASKMIVLENAKEIKIENQSKLSSEQDIQIKQINNFILQDKSILKSNKNINIIEVENFRIIGGSTVKSGGNIDINSNYLSVCSMIRLNDEELSKILNIKLRNEHIFESTIEALSSKLIAGGNITITTPQNEKYSNGIIDLFNHQIIAQGNIKLTGQQLHNYGYFKRPFCDYFEMFPGASIIEGNDIQLNINHNILNVGKGALIQARTLLTLQSSNETNINQNKNFINNFQVLGGSSIISEGNITIFSKLIQISSAKSFNNEELLKIKVKKMIIYGIAHPRPRTQPQLPEEIL